MFGVRRETLEPLHEPDIDVDSRLLAAARPVVDSMCERLRVARIGVVLTDSRARILDRWVTSEDVRDLLDDVLVAPGFVFEEVATGTNGLGTAVEERRPVTVHGTDHYCRRLRHLTSVGVPVRHDVSDRIEGVLGVFCPLDEASPLLLPFIDHAVDEIQDRICGGNQRTEYLLLRSFLGAARSATEGVVVVGQNLVIASPLAARLLSGVDHMMLWERAAEVFTNGHHSSERLPLPDGRAATVSYRPVRRGSEPIGAVVELQPATGYPPHPAIPPADGLPGLVGGSSSWRRACTLARCMSARSLPLLLYGEAGVGKMAVLRSLHETDGTGNLTVYDLAEASGVAPGDLEERLRRPDGTIVLQHLEELSPASAELVEPLLVATARRRAPQVHATITTTDLTCSGSHPAGRLAHRVGFGLVRLPSLRERPQDIGALANALLHRHSANGASSRFRPETIQVLSRREWGGNVRELETLVLQLVAAGVESVRLEDLPVEVRTEAARRPLTRLEQVELHTMLMALRDTGGNKKEAALQLGVSRSTLYRRLRALGVDLSCQVF
jgi:transcriptional regulator of acetoin/glycerol metabolism